MNKNANSADVRRLKYLEQSKSPGTTVPSIEKSLVHTVKSRAVDRSTIQFWNFLAKGHST